MFGILALSLDFEGAKNILVLKVLIWGLGRYWRLVAGVWHLNLEFYITTDLWYTNALNFGSLS